jgi:hypothetical protein
MVSVLGHFVGYTIVAAPLRLSCSLCLVGQLGRFRSVCEQNAYVFPAVPSGELRTQKSSPLWGELRLNQLLFREPPAQHREAGESTG